MKDIVLIDTNLYLDDANIIYKLAAQYDKILIPITVLKELDKKKYHKDLSYSARKAIHAILDFIKNNNNKIIFDIDKYNEVNPDEEIIASAKRYDATLATKDVSMSIIASSVQIKTMLQDVALHNIYTPYINIHMDDLNKLLTDSSFSYNKEYVNEEYYYVVNMLSNTTKHELSIDAWWFVIIDIDTGKPVVYANNPITRNLIRIDNNKKYREFKKDGSVLVKARDIYQVCAIYSMIEAPNTLLCGSYGSGKSLLSSAYAFAYNSERKTFISRPNLTVDRRFELGFLPGMLEDKLLPWMAGFVSSLYYMFSNTKGQISDKISDNNSYDFVKEQILKKYFEMIPLDSLQGMSFMEGDLLLLDEVQLCSIPILSIVLSRFGEGSKLVMTGDIKQGYNVIPPSENGLLKLLRLLPNKYLSYVELKNNYRSELINLANDLQDKSIL